MELRWTARAVVVSVTGSCERNTWADALWTVATRQSNLGAVLVATKRDQVLAGTSVRKMILRTGGIERTESPPGRCREDEGWRCSRSTGSRSCRTGRVRLEQVSEVIQLLTGHALTLNKGTEGFARAAHQDLLEIAIEEVISADLETFLDAFRSILIHAVIGSTIEDKSDGSIAIVSFAVLADVLNAPITILATSDVVEIGQNFVDARALVILITVLEDVLDDETTSLTDGYLRPLTNKCSIDSAHDHWWGTLPSELEELLPDVASIAMNNGVPDTREKFTDHLVLEALWNTIKSLLDDMATESISAEANSVVLDVGSEAHDLIVIGALEDALDEEVAEAIAHQLETTTDDAVNDRVLESWFRVLDLLLEEDGGLLIVAGDDFVDNQIPVSGDTRFKKLTPVDLLSRVNVDMLAEMRWVEGLASGARTVTELGSIGVQTRANSTILWISSDSRRILTIGEWTAIRGATLHRHDRCASCGWVIGGRAIDRWWLRCSVRMSAVLWLTMSRIAMNTLGECIAIRSSRSSRVPDSSVVASVLS